MVFYGLEQLRKLDGQAISEFSRKQVQRVCTTEELHDVVAEAAAQYTRQVESQRAAAEARLQALKRQQQYAGRNSFPFRRWEHPIDRPTPSSTGFNACS